MSALGGLASVPGVAAGPHISWRSFLWRGLIPVVLAATVLAVTLG
ncbi:MAG TPA: hypothetical protein VFT31_17470 [Kribbella sp.]|nr:hypothetical protein [Kribbella sp.]